MTKRIVDASRTRLPADPNLPTRENTEPVAPTAMHSHFMKQLEYFML